ncbi:MAG TPA: hypothetical protein VGX91_11970 [Candidatus Cybelea sp.]|nr:hypothetical protein [Candidatus Cybelea sp.]
MQLLRSLRADPALVDPLQDDEPVSDWETVERDAERRIADAEKRIQRAWKLAEEAALDPSQLRARLAELDAQRRSAEEMRSAARAARARMAEHQQSACSFAELIQQLPDLWLHATVELQQELGRALDAVLTESPKFGGLYADPSSRGKLVSFHPGAKRRKTEVRITKRPGFFEPVEATREEENARNGSRRHPDKRPMRYAADDNRANQRRCETEEHRVLAKHRHADSNQTGISPL